MIYLQVFALCDGASVREGMLSALSMGVTQLFRDTYPAPLGCSIAVLFTAPPEDEPVTHQIRFEFRRRSGEDVGITPLEFEFSVDAGFPDDHLPGNLPVVLDVSQMSIPSLGMYDVLAFADDRQIGVIPFEAMPPVDQ